MATYQEISRDGYGPPPGEQPTLEGLIAGALLRIAEALETISVVAKRMELRYTEQGKQISALDHRVARLRQLIKEQKPKPKLTGDRLGETANG